MNNKDLGDMIMSIQKGLGKIGKELQDFNIGNAITKLEQMSLQLGLIMVQLSGGLSEPEEGTKVIIETDPDLIEKNGRVTKEKL